MVSGGDESAGPGRVGAVVRRSVFSRVVAWVDDWLNPIVVKEVRQAVRAKYVLSVFVVFLVGELVTMGLYLDQFHGNVPLAAGEGLFALLFVVLSVTCTVLVPVYCGVRVALERGKGRTNLVLATPMPVRSVVAGKLMSGAAISLLIYSVSAPLLVFTYLLRGIGLPTILWMVAFGFSLSVLAIQMGVFVGSLREKVIAKGILGVLVGGGLCWVSAMAVNGVLSDVFLVTGIRYAGVFAVVVVLAAAGHAFVWTVAAMSPVSSNWARPMRVFVTCAWFVTGVLAFLGGSNTVAVWGLASTAALCVALFITVSEPPRPSRQVARLIPASGMRRFLPYMFSTGIGSGMLWVWSMAGLSALAVFVVLASGLMPSMLMAGGVLVVMVYLWFGAMASAMTALLVRWSTGGRLRAASTGVMAALIWIVTAPLGGAMGAGYIALCVLWSIFAGLFNVYAVSEGTWPADSGPAGVGPVPGDMTPKRISQYWRADEATRPSTGRPDPDGIPRSTVRLYKRRKRRFFIFGTRDE